MVLAFTAGHIYYHIYHIFYIYNILSQHALVFKTHGRGQRDGAVVESTCCGPRFRIQYPQTAHNRLLLQAQCSLLASVVRGIYMVHLHTYIQANTHTYKIKMNTPLKLKIRYFRHGQLKRPTCSFEMFF